MNDVTLALLAHLLRDGTSIVSVVVAGDARIVAANAAFARYVGSDPVGKSIDQLVTPESYGQLLRALEDNSHDLRLIQLLPAHVSLRAMVARAGDGYVLVGELPAHRMLQVEEQLMSLNAELGVLHRHHARQARLLEEAHHELRDAYWHVRKTSEVLPICSSCSAVNKGNDEWEDLSTFMNRNASFLSHGYCLRCAEALLAQLENEVTE